MDYEGNFKGFDLIIGNPPYIRQEEIKELKPHFSNVFEVYKGTSDIYTYFYERGFKILKDKGILNFITSNKFTRAGYGEPLRDFLLKYTSILEFIDLNGIKVFEKATVDTSIVMFEKRKPDKSQIIFYSNPKDNKFEILEYSKIKQSSLNKEAFIFGESKILDLKKKIEKIGKPLKNWNIQINYGIKTGFNEAFIIDEETKNKLIEEDKKSKEIIKPLLRGRDIKRYSYDFKNLYLICTFPALNLNISDYPAIEKYLKSFGKRLEQSGEIGCRKKTIHKWFEMQDTIAYYKDFEKFKIVWASVGENEYSYIEKGIYLLDTNYFLVCDNEEILKYLIGVFNSKLFLFALSYKDTQLGDGGAWRHYKYNLEEMTIPEVDKKTEKEIVNLVEKVIEGKKKGIDTREFEEEIDRLVYWLYGLSEEEVGIIEGKY